MNARGAFWAASSRLDGLSRFECSLESKSKTKKFDVKLHVISTMNCASATNHGTRIERTFFFASAGNIVMWVGVTTRSTVHPGIRKYALETFEIHVGAHDTFHTYHNSEKESWLDMVECQNK